MEDSEKTIPPSRLKDGARSVLFMMAVCAVFVGAIASVRLALADRIRLNQNQMDQRQRLEAMGLIDWRDGSRLETNALYAGRVTEYPAAAGGPAFHVARTPDGSPLAVALVSTWQGFWGPITAMIVLDPKAERIKGISFLKHSETPGLGARMTEPPFRGQFFEGAKTIPGVSGPDAVLVPEDKAQPQPSEISAITGATRTSDTFVAWMNHQLPAEVKAIQPRLKEVK